MCPPTVGVAVTFISTSHKAPLLPQVAAACCVERRKASGRGDEMRQGGGRGGGGGEKEKAAPVAGQDSEDVLLYLEDVR